MNAHNLVNDLVGCIRGQMPLRHCWDALPTRVQSMVRTAMVDAVNEHVKEEPPSVVPPPEPKPSRPRVTAKRVVKKTVTRK